MRIPGTVFAHRVRSYTSLASLVHPVQDRLRYTTPGTSAFTRRM